MGAFLRMMSATGCRRPVGQLSVKPALDTQAAAEFVILQAKRAGNARVYPIGAISKGRLGHELAEIGGLVAGGAVAFTDDGSPVVSAELMRRALESCRRFDKAILSHSEDKRLSGACAKLTRVWAGPPVRVIPRFGLPTATPTASSTTHATAAASAPSPAPRR